MDPDQLIKHCKEEFDRLMETSPFISDKVVAKFKKTFADGVADMKGELPDNLTVRQQAYLDLKKPEVCGIMQSTSHSVYKGVRPQRPEEPAEVVDEEGQQRVVQIEQVITEFVRQKQREPTNQEVVNELDGAVTIEMVEQYRTQI